MAGGVLWFAHTTAAAGGPEWHTNLAQAARLMALIGVAIAVLSTISVLTNDQSFFGTFSAGF